MPMLTDLGDACRKSGLRVVEEPNWQRRGHGAMAGVRSVLCHHTAGPRTGDLPSLRVVRDGRSDLAGPLAQLMLSRSGAVHVIAAGQCWHAGATWTTAQSNPWSIGIEAEATGVDPWPAAQYEAYLALVRALCAHYRIPYSQVFGHKEAAKPRGRKSDPNFDMNDFRARLGRASVPGNTTPAAPPPPPIRFGEDHEMREYTPMPPLDSKGNPTTPKNQWPSRTVSFGFDQDKTKDVRAHWGSRGGWLHSARWWVRGRGWTANVPLHDPSEIRVGAGGSERFVGFGWVASPPAGADELELTFSAPDGLHIFPAAK